MSLLKNIKPMMVLVILLIGVIVIGIFSGCRNQQPASVVLVGTPSIGEPKVGAPSPQQPGEEIGISIEIASTGGATLNYTWTADGGEIVRGQGSPAITYRVPEKPGTYNIRVKIEWNGQSVEKVTSVKVEAEATATPFAQSPTDTPTAEPPTHTPVSTSTPTQTQKPANTPTPEPTSTPTSNPTNPTHTPTSSPTATSLPGSETIPVANLAPNFPWLPLNESAIPVTYYYGFNVTKPPFDNRLVRQAFALSIDRQAIANVANNLGFIQPRPATTFTHPDVLGRNLYEQVGLSFNPDMARQLLAEAGYPNGEGFPQVILVFNTFDNNHKVIAEGVVTMWHDNLGVNVGLESVDDWNMYQERLASDAPSIYRLGWGADYADPDNFLKDVFHSSSESNHGHFSNTEFDQLVEQGLALAENPAPRQGLYVQAEQILCEQEAAIIPLYHYYTAR